MTPQARQITGNQDLTEAERQLQIRVAIEDAINPDAWRRLPAGDDVPMLYETPEDRGFDLSCEWDDPDEVDWEPGYYVTAEAYNRRTAIRPRTYSERLAARRAA